MAGRFHVILTSLFLGFVLVCSAQFAMADTILHYQGNSYTDFPCPFVPFCGGGPFSFTPIVATVDLAGPLLPSQNVVVTPISWTLDAGDVVMTNNTPGNLSSIFEFSTNPTGKIVDWNVGADTDDVCGYGIHTTRNADFAFRLTSLCLSGSAPDEYGATNVNSPGQWTVSEPLPLGLLILGFLGITFIVRQERCRAGSWLKIR